MRGTEYTANVKEEREGEEERKEGVQSERVKVKGKTSMGFLLKTEWTNTRSSPVLICMSFKKCNLVFVSFFLISCLKYAVVSSY